MTRDEAHNIRVGESITIDDNAHCHEAGLTGTVVSTERAAFTIHWPDVETEDTWVSATHDTWLRSAHRHGPPRLKLSPEEAAAMAADGWLER